MGLKTINVADASGARRDRPELHIWRNNITGMEPGSVVMVRFTDEYTRAKIEKVKPRKYIVVGIKFDDDFARRLGRHTVTLHREKGTEVSK